MGVLDLTMKSVHLLKCTVFCLLLINGRFGQPTTKLHNVRLSSCEERLDGLEKKLEALGEALVTKDRVGTTYVRWGRHSCPSSAEIIYAGYAGSSHYRSVGGTVDYLCLPNTPEFYYGSSDSDWRSFLYGVQFETGLENSPFTTENLHNQDVPCALCNVRNGRHTLAVIPSWKHCPSGWTQEYWGYMMSAYDNHDKPTRAVCVDKDPEKLPGGFWERNEGLMYPMKAKCGILPCPPYENKEITCVVCTI